MCFRLSWVFWRALWRHCSRSSSLVSLVSLGCIVWLLSVPRSGEHRKSFVKRAQKSGVQSLAAPVPRQNSLASIPRSGSCVQGVVVKVERPSIKKTMPAVFRREIEGHLGTFCTIDTAYSLSD